MKILGSAVILAAFFALYGVVHSWLASLSVKNWLRARLGASVDRWYRLVYNIVAVVTFLPMLALMAVLPQQTLYVVPAPWRWLMVAGQLTALVAAGVTVLQTGIFHFIGLRQLVDDRPAENTPLNLRGFYRWVRHPLYFFSLIFLWLTPVMTTNSFFAYILFTLYFQFGSEHEERRLLEEFGEAYRQYRQTVPRLIPWPGRSYSPPGRRSSGRSIAMSNLSPEERERLEKLPTKLHDYRYPGDKPSRSDSVRRAEERQSLVEQRIQEAMANGEFDNLPGAGKPLPLNDNPYAEPGQEWAFGLLKRNGLAPEWIERDKSIRRQLEAARSELQAARQMHQTDPAFVPHWQRAVERFAAHLNKINRQIDDFNLVAPSLLVQRSRLNLERELQRLAEKEKQ